MPPKDPRAQLAREWLDRAELDLRLARLGAGDPSLAGLTAFHCQQDAEKALKAFLGWSNQPLLKTHDLPTLLARCRALNPKFVALEDAASILDDYLTAGRYPDVGPAPTAAEAAEAVDLADDVVTFVLSIVPQEGQQ